MYQYYNGGQFGNFSRAGIAVYGVDTGYTQDRAAVHETKLSTYIELLLHLIDIQLNMQILPNYSLYYKKYPPLLYRYYPIHKPACRHRIILLSLNGRSLTVLSKLTTFAYA